MKVYCDFKDERVQVYRPVIIQHYRVTETLENADVAVVDTEEQAHVATWYSDVSIILHILLSQNLCVVAYLRPDRSTIERCYIPLDFSLPYAGASTILYELIKAETELTSLTEVEEVPAPTP
jgi:hypothetical protein